MSRARRHVAPVLAAVLVIAACSSDGEGAASRGEGAGSPTTTTARATGGEPAPYPYTTPTPPAERTPADGVYRRVVDAEVAGGAGKCRRCPPYRLAPGPERLTLDRGVFRIRPEGGSGFRTVGHYAVSGDRIELFNDPNCPRARGEYRWRLAAGRLSLEAVRDDCAFGDVRSRYLTALDWTKVG